MQPWEGSGHKADDHIVPIIQARRILAIKIAVAGFGLPGGAAHVNAHREAIKAVNPFIRRNSDQRLHDFEAQGLIKVVEVRLVAQTTRAHTTGASGSRREAW